MIFIDGGLDGLHVILAVLLRSAGLSDFVLFCRAEALDFGPCTTIRLNEQGKTRLAYS